MKVAIPVWQGRASPVFDVAGRLLLVEVTDRREIDRNALNLNAPQGAGIQAGQTVARLGVEAILTGHIGPKA